MKFGGYHLTSQAIFSSAWNENVKCEKHYGVQSRGEILAPLDFSFMQLKSIKDCENEEPRHPGGVLKKVNIDSQGRYNTQSIKFNNNNISSVEDMVPTLLSFFGGLDNIFWIDLSCNELTKINDCFLEFPYLRSLQLHGNRISDIKEVDKLARLPSLKKLTLHGNKIEREKSYFAYVVGIVPSLISLDFTTLTHCDKVQASTFRTMVFGNQRRKPKRDM